MEPRLIKLCNSDKESFSLNKYQYSKFPGIWHYHTEFEITYIIKGEGTRFVGDHIESFYTGDLIMLGSNMPHTWKSDISSSLETENNSQALVLHFITNSFGEHFWNMHEVVEIKNLLERSKAGLKISGPATAAVIKLMLRMVNEKSSARLITLLSILEVLAFSQDLQDLSSIGFVNSINNNDSERINKAYQYIMNNFKSKLSLKEVARIANMSESAFSRFFCHRTRKSFTQFVTELKIGYACKLLIKEDKTVTQVCYECGFNNVSNFNKQFRKINHITPKKYQQSFVKSSG